MSNSSKNIIICCDGTRNFSGSSTNVWRLCDGLKYDEERQIKLYLHGVGVAPFSDRWFGSAFGLGLSNNIRTAYIYLLKHYNPGDRIYLFGFSRGAYTARSLANVLNIFGLPKARVPLTDVVECSKNIYWAYRFNKIGLFGIYEWISNKYHKNYDLTPETKIEMVGVWDTVGAVQRPSKNHWYHQVGIADNVKKAVHAVSLDEKRCPFAVHLFNDNGHTVIDEVWFPGDHSDVGGGHEDDRRLSKISLAWMIKQLPEELELRSDAPGPDYGDNYKGKLHDLSAEPCIKKLIRKARIVSKDSKLHVSVRERHLYDGYAPECLRAVDIQNYGFVS